MLQPTVPQDSSATVRGHFYEHFAKHKKALLWEDELINSLKTKNLMAEISATSFEQSLCSIICPSRISVKRMSWLPVWRQDAYNQSQEAAQRTKFTGPTWGPSGADRTQVGPMLTPWTLLSVWPIEKYPGVLCHPWLFNRFNIERVNFFCHSATWCLRSLLTLVPVRAYCLTAPICYLIVCCSVADWTLTKKNTF